MKRILSLVVIVIVLSMPALVVAGGPLDGAYSVIATSSNGQFLDYVFVLQNGAQIVLTILYPDVPVKWFYGIGTLNGNTASGTLYGPDNASFGSFNVTLGADGSLSGTLNSGLTVGLNGSRIF